MLRRYTVAAGATLNAIMVRRSRASRSSGNGRPVMEGNSAYSTIEVAKHASREDAWIIIGGKVLSISGWLNEHPGGDDVLLDLAGKLFQSSIDSEHYFFAA